VFVVGPDRTATEREVTTGLQSTDRIEIVSGVEDGARLLNPVSAPIGGGAR
jgi:hypothetical protein